MELASLQSSILSAFAALANLCNNADTRAAASLLLNQHETLAEANIAIETAVAPKQGR